MLLLSTSRTSWLLALTAPAVISLMRGQRRYLIPAILVVAVAVGGTLASSRGGIILKYVDKVISPNRTLSQKTSGRLEMYEAFPEMFSQSPVWGWGPGSGGSVYRNRSGETMMLHSLFLHIGVELGAIGLAFLIVFNAAVLHRAWVYRRSAGDVVPLAAALCVCLDALAHNSFNPLTGAYLGLALTDLSRCWVIRTVPPLHRQNTVVVLRDLPVVRDARRLPNRRPGRSERAVREG
jgi:O-antigen ligase